MRRAKQSPILVMASMQDHLDGQVTLLEGILTTSTQQTLKWNPEGSRRRERPKTTQMRSVDKKKKLMKKARPGKTLFRIVCGGSCGPASAEGTKELSQESLTVFKERFYFTSVTRWRSLITKCWLHSCTDFSNAA